MKRCIPCGAESADNTITCGFCGEGSWSSDVDVAADTVPAGALTPTPAEPETPADDAASDATGEVVETDGGVPVVAATTRPRARKPKPGPALPTLPN